MTGQSLKGALWALSFAALFACGRSDAKKAPDKPKETAAALKPAAKAELIGSVTGYVRLAPDAQLPLGPDPRQAKNAVSPPPCPPISDADRQEVRQGPGGGLYPVHLAITEMTAAPERKPMVHELRIDNCRLNPGLIGAQVGDAIHIVNRSTAPLLPQLPSEAFMQAILPGQSRDFKIDRMGPTRIACGFGGYCGQSVVIGVGHPLYAVTDGAGLFKIEKIPVDQDLMLHAWHPLFQVTSAKFRLSKAQPNKTIDLVLKPQPEPAPESSDKAKDKGQKNAASKDPILQ